MDKRVFTRAKWLVAGILAVFIFSGTALTAGPTGREIVFGVGVSFNGSVIQFEDDMRPFIMDGRTFLPVRAIAEIVGLDVDFDGAANTVILTTDGATGDTQMQALHPGAQIPMRGAWLGNVYTNDYLGFSFNMPAGWTVHTDDQNAAIMHEVAEYIISHGIYMPFANEGIFIEMMVSDFDTGTNMIIQIERLSSPMGAAQYAEMLAQTHIYIGGHVNSFPDVTRIGAHYWYSFSTELNHGNNIVAHGRRFVTVLDGYGVSVIISYVEGHETPDNILAMFEDAIPATGSATHQIAFGVGVSLDGEIIQFEDDMRPFIMDGRTFLPVRAIAEIVGLNVDFDGATYTVILSTDDAVTGGAQEEHQLLGIWAWDGRSIWQYNFHPDGTGARGIAPHKVPFIWQTEDDHLIMNVAQFEESWTFVIDGNILTLTSRQIDDMEYSYIRVTDGASANNRLRDDRRMLRGRWDGDVYTNEFLGLRFTLPDGWFVPTDAEIAGIVGGAEVILEDAGIYIDVSEDFDMFVTMMARNPAGSNVGITFQRIVGVFTELEMIELIAEHHEETDNVRVNLDSPGPTRIGAHYWYSFDIEIDFVAVTTHGRQFITFLDGFAISINITCQSTEALDDIFAMFSGI